jgi:Uncharacterized conserved protein (DUF2190)
MAYGNFILDKGYDAESALTAFRAVKPGATTEGVTACTAEGDQVLGISQFAVSAAELALNKGASVRLMGISEVEAVHPIARGGAVGIDGSGRAIAANTGSRLIGVALQATAATGDRIAVLLSLPGALSA